MASGLGVTDAHEQAGYKRNKDEASKMKTRPEVAERLRELLAESAKQARITRGDLIDWAARLLQATPSQASLDSDICEEVVIKGEKVARLCDKGGAFDRLVRLCGWQGPEKEGGEGSLGGAVRVVIEKL